MKRPVLEPPAHLTEGQREVWIELAEPLLRAGRLERIDVPMFQMLVTYTDEARRYSRLADEAEDETTAKAARTVADDAERMAAKVWREFLPLDS